MSDLNDTTKDRGDALENNIAFLFRSAGFETKQNIRVASYEIDVLARIGDTTVIVECKNYQYSTLTIRNLIHQWNSKNLIVRANKIILALAGLEVKTSDYQLAQEFDIEIWNETTVSEMFSLSLRPSELRSKLFERIDIKPVTIGKFYRDRISGLVIEPLLRGESPNKEVVFHNLNRWLRTFIRTSLQQDGTNKEDRAKHIELFEGTKSKRVFFNLLNTKRSEIEYWQKLRDRLSSEQLLSAEVQSRYFGMMEELLGEYDEQCRYFISEQYETRIRRLIRERLYYSLISDHSMSRLILKNVKSSPTIEVIPLEEGAFRISLEGLSTNQVNVVNWLLTSEETHSLREVGGKQLNYFSWPCYSLDEAAEKVFRLLDEFIGTESSAELRDLAL